MSSEGYVSRGLVVKLGLVVVLLLILAGVLIPYFFRKPEGPGEFGDMFGVVNALFSGLAFIGIIYAIILQQQELSLQRQELKLTREEMSQSRVEQAKQAKALKQTAKISALSTLVQSYTARSLEKVGGHTPAATEASGKLDNLIQQLEAELQSESET